MAHSRREWLDRNATPLKFEVPLYERCELGSGEGRGGDTTDTGEPCYYCKHRSVDRPWLPDSEKLPGGGDCFVVKSEAGKRAIPIKNSDTEKVLLSYFKIHDSVGTSQAVRDAVKRIADRAGLLEIEEHLAEDKENRYWPTTHDLRDTFGHQLARKGFGRFEIKAAMGHADVQQADDYIALSGRELEAAFNEKWDE